MFRKLSVAMSESWCNVSRSSLSLVLQDPLRSQRASDMLASSGQGQHLGNLRLFAFSGR